MVKVKAKGKVKRKVQDAAEEAELAQKDLERTPVVKSQSGSDSKVPTRDIVQVIADSIESSWEKIYAVLPSEDKKRLAADQTARYIAGSLIYGMHGYGAPVKIREAEVEAHYCKEHS